MLVPHPISLRLRGFALLGALAFGSMPTAKALTFVYTPGPTLAAMENGSAAQQQMAANVVNGFNAAGAIWSSTLSNSMTVNITIDFKALSAGVLGQAGASFYEIDYSNIRSALVSHATSATDASAVSHLQTGPALTFHKSIDDVVNTNPPVRVLDNDGTLNNTRLGIYTANAKALGLAAANGTSNDASITFSSNFAFDYDRSNGIAPGTYDFVGVAAHEIGHALGFVSGVDDEDFAVGPNGSHQNLNNVTTFGVLDLFRFSALGDLDLSVGGTPYFSVDNGLTNLGFFSTGTDNGDGWQASHWRDNAGIGLMDPTLASGETGNLTSADIAALDAIGYTVSAVPEPATVALLVLGIGAIGWRRARRQA